MNKGPSMSGYYKEYIDSISGGLADTQVTDADGRFLSLDEGLGQWARLTSRIAESRRTIFFVGNGASAAMAAHMSADATKNGKLCCMNFNDSSLMTAVSNDIDYRQCFSMPLSRFGEAGDMLVTISSSGNSPNIVAALESAQEMNMSCVTLSGMKSVNKSRQMGSLNFYVPTDRYGYTECSHQVILHCWLDYYMEQYLNERI